MKKYILKKSILSASFIILSFVFIALTFPVMNLTLSPSGFIIDLLYVVTITSICFIMPMIYQEIFLILSLFFEFSILISSSCLYLSRGDIFNWSILWQIFQLKAISDAIKIPTFSLIFGIVLIIIFILLCILIKKPKIQLKIFYNKITLIVLSSIFLVASGGNVFIHLFIKKHYNNDDYFRSSAFAYTSFYSSKDCLQRFGFYGYYVEDFYRRLFPGLTPKINFPENSFSFDNYSSVLEGLCEDNNVVMFYAESFDIYGISPELTPVLYSLKNGVNLSNSGILNYYNVSKENGGTSISRKDFNYDKHTNTYVFNGTNIYDGISLNEVGIDLANHIAYESTNCSEIKSLTGFPENSTYASPTIIKYSLPQTLNNNYSTNYIHGNSGSFYYRNLYMQTLMGFENVRFSEDMQNFFIGSGDLLDCTSLDSATMKHYIDNQDEFNCFPVNEKFFTYFMTVTTHNLYTYSSFLDKNYALIDSISNSSICSKSFSLYNSQEQKIKNTVREYFARVLDTEYTLALLINYLYENNILENTIIVFAGDHNAFGNGIETYKTSYLEKILNISTSTQSHLVEGFIYSTQIKNSYLNENGEDRKVTHITEAVDLTPTILTLLGIEYNQEFYMGSPVINKSFTNPTETVYNHLHRSFFYGVLENDKLITIDGINIKSKIINYSPTQEELNTFIKDYNKTFAKYYHVLNKRNYN